MFGIQRFHAYENVITNSVFRHVNFAEVSLFTWKKCSIIGKTTIKSLNFQMQRIPERFMHSFPSKN